MGIYFINLGFIILLGILFQTKGNNKAKEKLYITIAYTSIFIVAAFRDITVGTDTKQYQIIYSTLAHINYSDIFDIYRSEYGYILLNKVLSFFTLEPQAITIVTSGLIVLLMAIFVYNNSQNVYVSTFLFLTTFYFCISMNASRQFISVVLICNSFYFLKRQKTKLFIFMILLASLFHLSSIVFLVVIILKFIKPNAKNFIIICTFSLVVTLILMFSNDAILNIFSYYDVYQNTRFFTGNSVRGTYLIWVAQLALAFISIFILNKNQKKYNDVTKFEMFYLSIFMVFSVSMGLIGTKLFILSRMTYYFGVFMIIFIPNILAKINKVGMLVYIPLYLVLTLYYFYMLKSGSEGVVPYNFSK
ncbi:EpsG family protein [Paenibacillus camerounensis]|uniref:EpsG family protein n=1 Tax=Paenibacillus camerounensis TaxID=1243663 RepID=UPI0005A74176|nr:EpsG family protein [Paenibacillus camerounensis]